MRSPKIVPPQEDPADKAARQAEQARAESSRIAETQGILSADTLRRLRRFGKTAQQSVPITAAAASAGGASGSGSVLSAGSGFSLGDITIGGGGGFVPQVQLY
jgi:hypothetical protein